MATIITQAGKGLWKILYTSMSLNVIFPFALAYSITVIAVIISNPINKMNTTGLYHRDCFRSP